MAQAQGGPTPRAAQFMLRRMAALQAACSCLGWLRLAPCRVTAAGRRYHHTYALCSRLSCSRPRRCSGSSGVLEAGGKSRRTPGYMKKLGYCVHIICKAYVWVQGTPWYMANGTTHPLADRAVTRHFGAQRSPANSHVQRRLMAGACGLCSNSAPVQSGTAVHLR